MVVGRDKEQNARLIAAGPDMLTALQEVEQWADDCADVDEGRPNDAMRILGIVRTAIAKAIDDGPPLTSPSRRNYVMRDLITDLRSIEEDERVDFHARGTAERAAEEIVRLREEIDTPRNFLRAIEGNVKVALWNPDRTEQLSPPIGEPR